MTKMNILISAFFMSSLFSFNHSYATEQRFDGAKNPHSAPSRESTQLALVTHFEATGALSVIDVERGVIVGTPIKVGQFPQCMANTPDGKSVFAVTSLSSTVDVVDTATWQVMEPPIKVGVHPYGIVISPNGKFALVTNMQDHKRDGTVSIIDISSRSVVGDPIKVAKHPHGIAITPDGTLAFVANSGADLISVIDIGNRIVIQNISLGWQPQWISIIPDGKLAFVTSMLVEHNQNIGIVSIIDIAARAVVGTPIRVGLNSLPTGIDITPDGKYALVLNPLNGEEGILNFIDIATRKVVGDPIKLKGNLSRIVVTQDGKSALITCYDLTGTVHAIDIATRQVVGKPINVGRNPMGIVAIPMVSKAVKESVQSSGKVTPQEESSPKSLVLFDKHGNAICHFVGPTAEAEASKLSSRYPLSKHVWMDEKLCESLYVPYSLGNYGSGILGLNILKLDNVENPTKVIVDMNIARIVHISNIRAIRDRMLRRLDVQTIRAVGKGDNNLRDAVELIKDKLRNIPQELERMEAQSLQELTEMVPTFFKQLDFGASL